MKSSAQRLSFSSSENSCNSEASLALPRRYEYAPMYRKNQAMLFHLNPGDQGYPISGFNRTVSVEELSKTKYEAVSYVWGDPLDTVDIFAMDFDQFIDIDYFLTREEVYFAIASQLLLEAEYPLQLLSLVKHTDANFHEREMLMSWIPEWDVKSNLKTLGCHMTNLLACGRSREEYTTTAEGLYIQGVYVDHIVWQSDVLTAEDFPEFILRTSELPDSLRNTLKKLLPFLPDGASVLWAHIAEVQSLWPKVGRRPPAVHDAERPARSRTTGKLRG